MSTRYFLDKALEPIFDGVDGIARRKKMETLLNKGQPCEINEKGEVVNPNTKDKQKILPVLEINEPLEAIPYYSHSKTAANQINKTDLCKAIDSLLKTPPKPYFSNDSTHYDYNKLKNMCNVIASSDKGNPIITPEFCSRKDLNKTDIFNELSKYLKSTSSGIAQPAAAATEASVAQPAVAVAAANLPPALVDADSEEKSSSATSVATAATVAAAAAKFRKARVSTKKAKQSSVSTVPSAPVEQAVEAVSVVPVPRERDVIEILDTPPAEDEQGLPVLDFPKSAPLPVVPSPIVVDSVDKHTPIAVAAYEPRSLDFQPEFPPSPNPFLQLSPTYEAISPNYPPPSYMSSPADEKQQEQQPFATAAASNEKMNWTMAAATSERPSTERIVFPQEPTIDRTTLPSSLFQPNMFKPDTVSRQVVEKTKRFMSMLL